MGKIGLILDSTCGLSKKEVESMGFGFMPIIININGIDKRAGVEVDSKEMYSIMSDRHVIIKTSLPSGEDIMKSFDFVLKKFEKAIFISLSRKMSGTYNSARIISKDDKYKGKIFVYESLYSSPWTPLYVKEFIELVESEDSIEKIYSILDLSIKYLIGFLSPGDIWWFYKGGRISKMQYIAGSLMKMKPILTISDGEIKKHDVPKIRTPKKAMNKMCEMLEPLIKMANDDKLPFKYVVLDSDEKELTESTKDSLKRNFHIKDKDILITQLSPEQTAHMGPGSFGMTILISLKDLRKI